MDKSFSFGVSTSAFQIEGAWNEDGKSPSIWDTFSHAEGNIANNENGDVACDHYHRAAEDIELIDKLGVDTYRFSIAWTRIFPAKDKYNEAGMNFYKNLLLELKKRNIKASVTLFHWDLPQWCEDFGGWTDRRVIDEFREYCNKCFTELDGLVDKWVTINEPLMIASFGYELGIFAPGKKSTADFLLAWHHVALAHGLVVKDYRAFGGKHEIGIVLNMYQQAPATNSPDDIRASKFSDEVLDGWYLSSLFRGCYPQWGLKYYEKWADGYTFIHEGDMETIAEPIDFVGLNYYRECYITYAGEDGCGVKYELFSPDKKKTSMDWAVIPDGLIRLFKMVRQYTDLPIYVTETGSAWNDVVCDGRVHDSDRTDFLIEHLKAVDEANRQGLNIKGYYVWALMDNFEWAGGYTPRFGLVYIDYNTKERIPKDSYFAYKDIIKKVRSGIAPF